MVKKYREEFWYKDKYVVALDRVEQLGCFIEIENHNEMASYKIRNSELMDAVKELEVDLNKRNTEGYSNMLYHMKKGDR